LNRKGSEENISKVQNDVPIKEVKVNQNNGYLQNVGNIEEKRNPVLIRPGSARNIQQAGQPQVQNYHNYNLNNNLKQMPQPIVKSNPPINKSPYIPSNKIVPQK
jgi:hypothetical protein